MNLEKQKNCVNGLLKLIKDNPELPILPMVATEVVSDDSYGYWMGKWSSARVSKYWVSDGRVYEYEDFDELIEEWIDDNYTDYENLTDNELEELAKKIVNNYKWVDAIIVYIENI